MFQDNPLLAQLKQQMQSELTKKEGQVKASERGFGFLETDEKESFFIPPNEMRKVLHGDRITAIIRESNDKQTAEPETLINQGHTAFVGKLQSYKGQLQFVSENPLFKYPFTAKLSNKLKSEGLQEGDWVTATLQHHSLRDGKRFSVNVTTRIAKGDDPYLGRWVTLAKLGLPTLPPQAPSAWPALDESSRSDYRQLPFITIDNASTQDMDDALYIEQQGDNWLLYVAIADPEAYIEQGSALDEEAEQRGFTIYMPEFNVPMLPRQLSDELCSLQPNVDRPALVCKILVAPDGAMLEKPLFELAQIRSHAKLSYDDVSNYLEEQSSDFAPEAEIAKQLQLLNLFSQARLTWREHNALTFDDNPDYKFVLSEQGEPIDILCLPRRSAHRLVEEAMVLANICGADFLTHHQVEGVFNSQTGIQSDRIAEAATLLKEHGIDATEQALTELDGYCTIRRQIKASNNRYLDFRLRRMFAYSEFKPQASPHFAMGLPAYATWTSPIRKYSDLINHRQIKSILTQQPPASLDANMGNQFNEKRKIQRMAENGANAWLYAQYLDKHLKQGTEFAGQIIDVVRQGVRVKLTDIGAMAFIPAQLICQDKNRITCKMDTGHLLIDENIVLTQGDELVVKLHEVNKDSKNFIAKPAVNLS
ncbi:exoribonuclease II [Motilimonas eburnea]|uniref:exoribonuclease II n=1 Tax=Motilimonas eburnea TaxID=1737488 RepID=UPI001E505513|nr:exoribonuclease II [Motilimonas eburnea]MCE2570383.1 exoribonuclease II [Motilimonas eburnea]